MKSSDAGPPDAGRSDAGRSDAWPPGAGPPDAWPPGAGPPDAWPRGAGPREAGPDEPMDQFDLEILDGIREIFSTADPMPADLPERIRFSLAMRDLEAEVARLVTEEDPRLLAARGAEQSRTITFDSDSLTIMIRIDLNKNGTVRIDGWLAPPQCREIEMQTAADTLRVFSDEQGRFAFANVPCGTARLSVRPGEQGPGGSGRHVVTPALIL